MNFTASPSQPYKPANLHIPTFYLTSESSRSNMRQNFADQDPAVSRYNTFRNPKKGKILNFASLLREVHICRKTSRKSCRSDFILISPRSLSRTGDKISVRLRPAIIIHSAIDRGPFIASSAREAIRSRSASVPRVKIANSRKIQIGNANVEVKTCARVCR